MIPAKNIQEVISQQEMVIEWSVLHQNRAGYFAILYNKMTHAVQAAINGGQFEDNKRMESLIIYFANFYLQAWDGFLNKQQICNAWQQVFSACENKNLVVLQHLILGINTHINLDLAKAAVLTCPGNSIHELRNDFEKINDIIATLAQNVQSCLEKIWWPLKILADITNQRHKAVLNFSISNARKASWANALVLATVQNDLYNNHIELMEKMVVGIANGIMNPGAATSFVLKFVGWMEPASVEKIMDILKE